jgi:uncharacterized protein
MKLQNEFTVPAPVERAWEVLLDVERVAPCLPGATIEGSEGDEYSGTMKIKVGPITSTYKGTVKIQESDEAARRAVMRAQARDSRGQGTAAATITSTMEEVEGGTRVQVETDMRVTGPAAQFGRGVMQDVSAKLMTRFADCLAGQMQASPDVTTTEEEPEAAPPAEETAATVSAGVGSTEVEETGVPGASSGVSSADAEPKIPSASSGTSSATTERPTDDVLDLGEASREALLKRAIPLVAGIVGLLVLIRIIKR